MAALRVLVLLLLITEALFFLKNAHKVTFVSLGWSENSTLWDLSKLKLKGRERLLNGTFDLFEDMDNVHYSFAGEVYHDTQGDGNYKLYPFGIEKSGVCKTYKNYRSYFKDSAPYGVKTNFPVHIDPCPIKKGNYYLKNVSLSSDKWPAVLPRGYVRLFGYFYNNNVLVGNYSTTVLIESS